MEKKVLDIKNIMASIPHRYPFLMVDRVLDFEKEKWIKAIKNVTINENFFQGHFPEDPIMPGVLMIEALAQTGGILCFAGDPNDEKLAYFMTIDNAKFRKPVRPGDQLVFYVEIKSVKRRSMVKMHGEATVDGELACQADIMFAIMDKE